MRRERDEGRGQSTYNRDPDDVVIIEDPTHPRYDGRIERPLDEEFVGSVGSQGVIEPCQITRDDDGRDQLINGRRRCRALRVVNQRRRAAGQEPYLLPCIYRRVKDDTEFRVLMRAANLHEADPPSFLAAEADYFHKLSWPPEKIGRVFGVGARTIKQRLALLECVSAVLDAVDAGHIALAAAEKLSHLPRNQQAAALTELREAKGGGPRKQPTAHPGISRVQIRKLVKAGRLPAGHTGAWLRAIVGAASKDELEIYGISKALEGIQ